MKPRKDKGGKLRWTFRWCRRSSYVVLLLLGGFLVYLNQVGVPGFLKEAVLGQLRERGIELEFSRMRVRLTRGLVAEDVNLSRRREQAGEVFHAEEVQLRLQWSALSELKPPQIMALVLRDGRITLPLPTGPDSPPYLFAVEDVQARLRFVSADLWELDELAATCHGGTFSAHGVLTNASLLRAQRQARTNASTSTPAWRRQLLEAARWLDRTKFGAPPEVHVAFEGDLRQPMASSAEFRLMSKSASNVLGTLDGLSLVLRVDPPDGTTNRVRADFELEAAHAATRWGELDGFRLGLGVEWAGSNAVPELLRWRVRSGPATSRWASVTSLDVEGDTHPSLLKAGTGAPWKLPPTNAPWGIDLPSMAGFESRVSLDLTGVQVATRTNPVTVESLKALVLASHSTSDWRSLHLSLDVDGATSAWSDVPKFQMELGLTPNRTPPETTREWAFWQPIVQADAWATIATGPTRLPRLSIDGAQFGLLWKAPRLEIVPFNAWFGNGELTAEAFLDVSTRHAEATAYSTANPHAVSGWMGPKAREQLEQYDWTVDSLPRLSGQVGLTLPGWGIPDHEARVKILESFTMDARLAGTNLTFRGLLASTGNGPITYTNRVWLIGPLDITRPEGSAILVYENDERTKDYRFDIRSTLDPLIVRPLLGEKIQKEMDRVKLSSPPLLEGHIWGRWQSPELIGFQVHVTATNAVVRDEPIEWADGDLAYTNRVITFRDVRARSGGEAFVPGAAFDLGAQLLSFTNARANVPVDRVTRIIGPKTAKIMEPYQFLRPPHAVVDGVVAVRGGPETDIRFDVVADDFRWWRLHGTNLDASVRVKGDTISISNLHSGFCGGRLAGDLFFDWSSPDKDTDYRLALSVTNVALRDFLGDVWPKTNVMEGRVTGRGEVTSANTRDPKTIRGSGTLAMEDGYLWGLPIFGLFSPIFDAVSPGLGQTRFTSGSASFALTNGQVRTDDFEMRSVAMRLRYRGQVSYEGALDANMEASLFRDAPLIGRLLSLAFMPVTKLLEYRVEGTLADPKPEPRYVPKVLMNLLRPISLLKSLLPKSDKPGETAAEKK
jgi:hypothetical protein